MCSITGAGATCSITRAGAALKSVGAGAAHSITVAGVAWASASTSATSSVNGENAVLAIAGAGATFSVTDVGCMVDNKCRCHVLDHWRELCVGIDRCKCHVFGHWRWCCKVFVMSVADVHREEICGLRGHRSTSSPHITAVMQSSCSCRHHEREPLSRRRRAAP